ncbi:MAG: hypothetical protein E6J54_10575 [Deltaproteobacteria bacterium]|nr:MAG: hypothetical protein E6J54_10575 [Deltaproteobacteria bacterium]
MGEGFLEDRQLGGRPPAPAEGSHSGLGTVAYADCNQRYDLANRAAQGITMSRGKPVERGVRVRLSEGMTWERLANSTEKFKARIQLSRTRKIRKT